MLKLNLLIVFMMMFCSYGDMYNYSDINLHPDHLPFFFNMYKELANKCVEDNCPLKMTTMVLAWPVVSSIYTRPLFSSLATVLTRSMLFLPATFLFNLYQLICEDAFYNTGKC